MESTACVVVVVTFSEGPVTSTGVEVSTACVVVSVTTSEVVDTTSGGVATIAGVVVTVSEVITNVILLRLVVFPIDLLHI